MKDRSEFIGHKSYGLHSTIAYCTSWSAARTLINSLAKSQNENSRDPFVVNKNIIPHVTKSASLAQSYLQIKTIRHKNHRDITIEISVLICLIEIDMCLKYNQYFGLKIHE